MHVFKEIILKKIAFANKPAGERIVEYVVSGLLNSMVKQAERGVQVSDMECEIDTVDVDSFFTKSPETQEECEALKVILFEDIPAEFALRSGFTTKLVQTGSLRFITYRFE